MVNGAPFVVVRMEGLEPPCLAALDPKSSASTNFATSACDQMENKYSFPIVDAKLKTYSNLLQGIEKKIQKIWNSVPLPTKFELNKKRK